MPWSSKTVLSKESAATKVLEFVPQKLELGTPAAAIEYLRRKTGSDFRMNDQVEIHTGVDRIEKNSDEERAERRALEMLAEIQEKGYDEAYRLGLDEGREKAFKAFSEQIESELTALSETLTAMSRIKTEILAQNEAHMIRLIYQMASRIASQHLEAHDEAVVEVLRSAISLAQQEENVNVQLHPSQMEFVEEIRKRQGREFEALRKVRLEGNEAVRRGGCIVETNSGEIDARVEQRLEQLWKTLSESMPRVKDKITG